MLRQELKRIRELKALINPAERGIVFYQNGVHQFQGLVPVPEALTQSSRLAIDNCNNQIANWWPEFVGKIRQAVIWGLGKLTDNRNSELL